MKLNTLVFKFMQVLGQKQKSVTSQQNITIYIKSKAKKEFIEFNLHDHLIPAVINEILVFTHVLLGNRAVDCAVWLDHICVDCFQGSLLKTRVTKEVNWDKTVELGLRDFDH